MADRFLNFAGGNTSPFETAANAATTLTGLLTSETVAIDEIIWAKNDSITAESSSANVTLTSEGGSYSHPLRVICAGDWDDSPSTLSTGAKITTTGNYSIGIAGPWLFHGVTFNPCYSGAAGSLSNTLVCSGYSGPYTQFFNSCTFVGMGHTAAHPIVMGNNANTGNDASTAVFSDCSVKFGNTSARLQVKYGRYLFNNLSFVSGSSVPASLFSPQSYASVDIEVTNSDWSSVAMGELVDVSAGFNGKFTFRNCKLNPGTSIVTSTWLAPGGKVIAINCSSADTHTRHEEHSYEGVVSVLTSIYATTTPADMSAGADDTYSIKMASSANVSRHLPLYSQWFCVWNDAASYTPSVEVLVNGDGATALNDDELFLEVDYNSGIDSPLGTRLTTMPDIITAGSACSAGTTAWTGDGYTTERTHKLSTSAITPDKPGYIWMRVGLAKPSATIYVNPPR